MYTQPAWCDCDANLLDRHKPNIISCLDTGTFGFHDLSSSSAFASSLYDSNRPASKMIDNHGKYVQIMCMC